MAKGKKGGNKTVTRPLLDQNEDTRPPYHFVYNNPRKVTKAEMIAHNSTSTDNLFSGELKLEITTLTKSIFGCYQKRVKIDENFHARLNSKEDLKSFCDDNHLTLEKDKNKKAKNFLYPAFYKSRSLILGSSIMGALRHNVGALTNAPMTNVQENVYGYRPNIGSSKSQPKKFEYRAAIIVKKSPLVVHAINESNIIFVTQLAKDAIDKAGLNTLTKSLPPRLKLKEKTLKNEGNTVISRSIISKLESEKDNSTYKLPENFEDLKLANYKGSTDSDGMLSKEFHKNKDEYTETEKHKPYKYILIPEKDIIKEDITIDDCVIDEYNKTTLFLTDRVSGHISSRHPNLPDKHEVLKKQIEINRTHDVGQVIFFEQRVQDGKTIITSFGNNYLYYWRYQNSVRYISKNGENKLRPQISSSASIDSLCMVDKLFGFSNEKCKNSRLSGSISINHAVEKILTKEKSVLNQNQNIALPILGSPKSSASEFYLKAKSGDSGIPNYGYSYLERNNNDLNGRKFYLHQQVLPNPNEEKNISEKLSTIVRYASPKGTIYQATLRYRNLKKWELGLLLVAINPTLLKDAITKNKIKNEKLKNLFTQDPRPLAQKLGYARSLGYGSCKIDICGLSDSCIQQCIQDYLHNQPDLSHLIQWLKIQRFIKKQKYLYPNQGEESYKFHSKVRSDSLKSRRIEKHDKNTNIISELK